TGNHVPCRARTLIDRNLCHLCSPAGPPVGLQDLLSQAERLWSDLDELVFGDEFDSLFKVQSLEWDQADGIIGCPSAHGRQFLLAHDIYVDVNVAGGLSDDHAFVHIGPWAGKQFAALLKVVQSISGGYARTVGNQGARDTMRDLTLILNVSIEK